MPSTQWPVHWAPWLHTIAQIKDIGLFSKRISPASISLFCLKIWMISGILVWTGQASMHLGFLQFRHRDASFVILSAIAPSCPGCCLIGPPKGAVYPIRSYAGSNCSGNIYNILYTNPKGKGKPC